MRYCAYCVGKATIITFGVISAVSLGLSVYFIYEVNSADNQNYYENVESFWFVFAVQYVIGVSQAWFLIEIVNLYIYISRQWRHAHMEIKEKEIKDRHCCVQMVCLCCSCIKWILCFVIIGCWRCLVWIFCPRWDDDGQDQFGVNYHEYVAWKNGEDIGQRVIPYKRMGTQNNIFYADDSVYEFEEGDETAFNAQDFLIKDLKVSTETHVELACVEGGNMKMVDGIDDDDENHSVKQADDVTTEVVDDVNVDNDPLETNQELSSEEQEQENSEEQQIMDALVGDGNESLDEGSNQDKGLRDEDKE